MKVALLPKLLTTLAEVDAFERTFIPVVVWNVLLMACSLALLEPFDESVLLEPVLELLLLLVFPELDVTSRTYAAVIQPPVDTLYQTLVPPTDVPFFWATTFTVVLLLRLPTTLPLVEALERTFNAAVVFTFLLIAVSAETLVLPPEELLPVELLETSLT